MKRLRSAIVQAGEQSIQSLRRIPQRQRAPDRPALGRAATTLRCPRVDHMASPHRSVGAHIPDDEEIAEHER